MTKTPVIIKDAYREGNLVAEQQALTATQEGEGLRLLNRVIAGVYGYEVGEPLYDWPIGIDGEIASPHWTGQEWPYLLQNVRMVTAHTAAQTIYLPPNPDDGARVGIVDPSDRLTTYPLTLYGNGRPVEDAPFVTLDANGTSRIWMYRADIGAWLRLNELTGDVAEDFPFPTEFDDFFITKLAMRINPRYGRSMDEQSVAALEKALRGLRARYRQTQFVPADIGVLALTGRRGGSLVGAPEIVRGNIGWMN